MTSMVLPAGTKYQFEQKDGTLSAMVEAVSEIYVELVVFGSTYNVYTGEDDAMYFVIPENEK